MSALKIRHLAAHCGSEIQDIDPRDMTDEQVARAKAEIANRCVLVIRNAHLSEDELPAFAQRFGPILQVGNQGVLRVYNNHDLAKDHPEFVRKGRIQTTNQWHTDASHEATPPAYTMLSAEEVPELYGDTMWINQYLAWETLSPAMQKMILPLRVGHPINPYFNKIRTQDTPLETYHPLVRVNADTGRKSLYINSPLFMSVIEGMNEYESAPLLEFLYMHSQQIEHSYRHRWQAGDLVCWDNRSTLHYALLDYPPSTRRFLIRVITKGEIPIPAETV
jgi:taurine dioxygenase